MHPHHHWYRHCGRPRPGRLFWFVLGAITATWVIKHKEAQHYKVAYCTRYQIPQEAYPHPSLNTHPQQQQPPRPESRSSSPLPTPEQPAAPVTVPPHTLPPPYIPQTQQDPYPRPWGWSWGWGCDSNSSSPEWGSRPGSDPHLPLPGDRWDDDRKRMHDIGRQAQETFTEFSEATLDTLLATIESLKAKLAEQKAQREKEEKELEALREEQERQYEEWKKQQPPRHFV